MGLFASLNRRRVIPWLAAYLAGGFIALDGVDQLIGNNLLPAVAYKVILTFYLFGIPGSMVMAWFHGEKGQQRLSKPEIYLQSTLVLGAIVTSLVIVQNYRGELAAQIDVAAEMGLDPEGVAVLYFEDLDGEYGFAADGLTEALIDRLSGTSLHVISRNGVEPYRGSDVSVDSIARALDVLSVVDGSVERRGDRFRITARLVDGFSGAEVQGARATFEVDEDELLSARDSLATVMERFLRTRMGREVGLRETRLSTRDQNAWSLFQRGEGLIRQAEEHEDSDEPEPELAALAAADSVLALAEVADSTWIDPPILRARAKWIAAFAHAVLMSDRATAEAVARDGLADAQRALARSPRDAKALEARGTLKYFLWLLDVSETSAAADTLMRSARTDLEGAVDADPKLATAWSMLSHLYGNLADNTNVILAARRAYQEDRFLSDADQILERLFWAHYDLRQFREARQQCDEGRRRFPTRPGFVECHLRLLLDPAVVGNEEDVQTAWALRDTLVQVAPEEERPFQQRLADLIVAGVLRKAELADSAEAVFARAQGDREIDPADDLVVEEAKIRSVTGDTDRAMDLLKRYVAAHPAHSFQVGGQLHWMWEPLRNHPDFRSVLEQR